jgi:hypothetical protein
MLELLLCSLVTILPDYLYRRYAQGKRFGKKTHCTRCGSSSDQLHREGGSEACRDQ